MRKEKGQDIIEYALMLAVVVGIGFGIYSYGGRGIANSISNVFNNAGSLLDSASLPAASSPEDIIKRLGDGRYQGLADILKGKPASVVDIAFDSEEGQALAQKLNIQTPEGDGWYARVNTNGFFVVTYYSAAANNWVTFKQLRDNYKSNPAKYGKDESTGVYKTTININEGYYDQNGIEKYNGTTTGHVEGLNGSMTSIYPGTYEKPKDQK
ncbi:Flp family type IVb pilin [Dialister succinatiphilus]|uniref:Flp family type IVb pilin n=1 Tax=Dialister succinatiphilus TaxID=487173 RepID=UPI0023557AF5|nr:hypothetical protein [Dialister succinatiphilus]